MKKYRLMLASIAIVGVSLAGCSAGGEDESSDGDTDALVVYASHPTEMVDYFVSEFEKENQGLEVELITGGTGELLSRVQAEKERPQGDILWGGSSTTGGTSPDLFEPYDSDVLEEIGDEFKDDAGFNAPSDAFSMVIVYNKDLVSEDEAPTTWAELADSKWKDKVHFANPESSSSGYAALVNWKLIGGWELIEDMAANMIIDDSSSAPFTAVGNGESELGVAYEEGAYRWLESGKVGIVYPTDGVVVLPGGLFQIKEGPNSANARKFADFVLSAEQQQSLVDDFPGRRPTNTAVELPDAMPDSSEVNLLEYPTVEAEDNQDEWLAEWREIMIG